jgi:hypothetical protein
MRAYFVDSDRGVYGFAETVNGVVVPSNEEVAEDIRRVSVRAPWSPDQDLGVEDGDRYVLALPLAWRSGYNAIAIEDDDGQRLTPLAYRALVAELSP